MAFPEFPTSLDARLAHMDQARAALLREVDAVAVVAGFRPVGASVAVTSSQGGEPIAPGFSPAERTQSNLAGTDAAATTDEWSVAEIVYHLHLSEKSIARLLRKRLTSADRNQPASEEQLRTEWERVARLVGIRETKVKAPAFAAPTETPAVSVGIELLGQSRQAVLEVVRSVPYADLLSVSAPHPFEAIGTLSGAGWLSVIAFHEHRHTEQIQEIKGGGK
jgi:hypothetical protein